MNEFNEFNDRFDETLAQAEKLAERLIEAYGREPSDDLRRILRWIAFSAPAGDARHLVTAFEEVRGATITVSLAIDNVYEEGGTIKTTVTDAVIPAPPPTGRDSEEGSEAWDEWAYDNLFSLTGTGREKGDAAYFATITASSDPSLVGEEFEWGV